MWVRHPVPGEGYSVASVISIQRTSTTSDGRNFPPIASPCFPEDRQKAVRPLPASNLL
jgi:hypothetical protein